MIGTGGMRMNDWRIIRALARHEWRLARREPKFLISWAMLFGTLLAAWGLAFVVSGGEAFADPRLPRLLLLLMGALSSSLTVALAADSFAGERERNTLEQLLLCPAPLATIFRGKVLGILPLPVLSGWAGQLLLFLLPHLTGTPSLPGREFAMALLFTLFFSLFVTAVSVRISLGAASVRAAAQGAGVVVLFGLLSLQFFGDWIMASWPHAAGLFLSLGLLSLIFSRSAERRFRFPG